jgi:hypothetical protein
MIKVVNLVSLLFAPIIVATKPTDPVVWVVAVAFLVAMIWAVLTSSKPIPELKANVLSGAKPAAAKPAVESKKKK